ncbi:MAG: hypothetical protein CM1200mP29_14280 [Verrucomicrobiota bacterium]|nr:MAG: hypothetical protein CM1200mP29_14280 [Verrucomicrobiota bacterium]
MDIHKTYYLIPLAGLLALLFTYLRAQWVARQDPGTDRMKRIAGYITDGAMAFLRLNTQNWCGLSWPWHCCYLSGLTR